MTKRELNQIAYTAALQALRAGDQRTLRAAEKVQKALSYLSLQEILSLAECRRVLKA